jgi:diacylglycerol diphosphate phosphatase/phosphatidate phosphatase
MQVYWVSLSMTEDNCVWWKQILIPSTSIGLLLTHAITLTATTVVKVTVGRPRPDLIDRCQPIAGSINAIPYGLVTEAICTTSPDSHLIRDGFR